MALSEPRAILLTIFEGREEAGTGKGIFIGGPGRARGAANTLRVGEKLHVAVVFAEIEAPAAPLVPGVNYSYNLAFGPFVELESGRPVDSQGAKLGPDQVKLKEDQVPPPADLRSEGLLADAPIGGRANKALGYVPGELPGFALPPPLLTDLRILQGSCRRIGYIYPEGTPETSFDGLAWVDDLIEGWRRGTTEEPLGLDPNVRPHQLFLTGDQIYSDDIPTPFVPMLNRRGNELIGRIELLPTRYPPRADEPSKEAFLGAPKQKGFATLKAFVTKMREEQEKEKDEEEKERKDPLNVLKEDRLVRVLQDPCFDRRFKLLYGEEKGDEDKYEVLPSVEANSDDKGLRHWPADLFHFPAARREPVLDCEAKFTSPDLKNHLISFGEYCAMYLAVVSNTVWELEGTSPKLATVNQVYPVPPGFLPDGFFPQLWELHHVIPFINSPKGQVRLTEFLEERRANAKEKRHFEDTTKTLTTLFNSLPRVRRALANVPTYMMFDDHDITDDWNLSLAWRDRVYTSELGRRVITSALVAYALFQDWGNDPKRYLQFPHRRVLELATELYPAESEDPVPTKGALSELEMLFALNQPDPEQPTPAVKWHFTVDGPCHRVVALDIRTRRRFRTRHAAPGLLSTKALNEQLPDPLEKPLPAGVDVLVVLSPTAALQPSLAASAIIPFQSRNNERKSHPRWRNLVGLEPDNEIWPLDDVAYEEFLRRLADYRKVVVMSGEVHHSYSAQMSYWEKGLKRIDLAAGLEGDLDSESVTPGLRGAFQAAGFTLSGETCVRRREGNGEWIVIDPENRRMFLVRKESDGLNVYEEEQPARFAQFTSSGLKNVKGDIIKLARLLGFGFELLDLTPAERLIWTDKTPAAIRPPEGGTFAPAVRDRLGNEPVLLPTRNWPPGTTIGPRQPDFAWRMDLVRDERPDGERKDFTQSGPAPELDPPTKKVDDFYREIATRHAAQLAKLRFGRGVVYQSNLGLVRFELDGEDLVARYDVFSHPPGKDEAVLVNTFRVPLEPFGEERPRLRFDLPVEA